MTQTVMRNNEVVELPDNGEHPDQTMTFDDVPLYSYVILRGDPAFILDKGDHLSDSDGRHMLVSFTPQSSRESDKTKLHERIVNKYLHESKHMFVDFTHDVPTGVSNDYSIPLPEEV